MTTLLLLLLTLAAALIVWNMPILSWHARGRIKCEVREVEEKRGP